jgi:ribosomal protein S12 methylthiotransferase accessory factor
VNRSIRSIPHNIAIELQDREILYRETGAYTLPPAETIQRAERVLARIGIVSVSRIESRYTDGVPIFRLNEAPVKARCHRQACQWSFPPTPLNDPPREVFGKGMSAEQSKASAMMEAVERYCGQRFPHHNVLRARYEEIQPYAVSPSQFHFPATPSKCENCGEAGWDCFPELPKVSREWSWGYSLVRKKPVLVPAALVYYPYISEEDHSFVYNDTGGLAAGNTMEEAILQGIAEVIERDALYSAFNLKGLRNRPNLTFQNTPNEYLQRFIQDHLPHEKIFVFRVVNENSQLEVPTYAAFVCYRTGDTHVFFGGSGTSLDPEIGLLRALTELEQQKVRQKVFVEFDPNQLVGHKKTRSGDRLFLEETPNRSSGNIKGDIEFCLHQLSGRNMDVIAVNLTHPEVGIPVVRIIIPGLISYSGEPIKESFLNEVMNDPGGVDI